MMPVSTGSPLFTPLPENSRQLIADIADFFLRGSDVADPAVFGPRVGQPSGEIPLPGVVGACIVRNKCHLDIRVAVRRSKLGSNQCTCLKCTRLPGPAYDTCQRVPQKVKENRHAVERAEIFPDLFCCEIVVGIISSRAKRVKRISDKP